MTIQHRDEYDPPFEPQPLHTPTVDYGKTHVSVKLPPLTSATVLRLEPGDVLVFKYAESLSNLQCDAIKDYVDGCFPGHNYMILEREMDLRIVRPSKAAEAT